MATLDFGLMMRLTNEGQSARDLLAFNHACIKALSAGFTTLWFEDHLQWGEDDSFESFTTMTYFAATYPQFHVGTMVLSQSYRNPALLAKMAANLQALTGGRVIIGLGAGWKEDEYIAYGYPFPPVKTRMDQLAEAAQILRAIWRGQPATIHGQHYHIENAYCSPQPVPVIPLLIGGGGEQRTLGIVARYADMWNFNSIPVEEYMHKLSILKQHCERIGRDPASITLTYLSTISASDDPAKVQRSPNKHFIAGNATEIIHELEQFQALGVRHCMFRALDVASLEYFVEHVVPHFREGEASHQLDALA